MNILKKLREQRNLTQEDLASELGVTRQMISAIERGANPGIKLLKQLATYFNISTDELLNVPPPSQQSRSAVGE